MRRLVKIDHPAPDAPKEEDRCLLSRERKALTTERVRHANRIKVNCLPKAYLATSLCAATGSNNWRNSRPAMPLNVKGIGPEFAAVLWSEGLSRHFENR